MHKGFKCTQCGAMDFLEEDDKLRCNYCKSLYFIDDPSGNSGVVIKKGAKVVFGKGANVTIRGKLTIEDGADVAFNGTITLIEKASDEEIEKAKLRLANESEAQ